MNEIHSHTASVTVTTSLSESKKSRTKINLSGNRFGRLMVISQTTNIGKNSRWECQCDCGSIRLVLGKNLLNGKSTSCGCFTIERTRETHTTHGMSSNKSKHPVYQSYLGIKKRCFVRSDESFKDYGGRGITVCERWLDANNFIQDMLPSWRPGLSIDRIDVNGNYEPGNCRWATPKQQARNTRTNRIISIGGVSKCISEWADFVGINHLAIRSRLNRGWSEQESVFGRTKD